MGLEIVYLALGTEISRAVDEMEYYEEYEVDSTYVGSVFKWDPRTDSIKDLIEACIGWDEYRVISKEIYLKILFQIS